jgi:sugar/nucleoside kinase (ribokinase family)
MPRPRPGPSIVVLGDLMLDAVLAPSRAFERGTDVPGRVMLRQGGSAANTARWLGRLGVRAQLITAVGRDAAGRALVAAVRSDGVVVRAIRVGALPSGRIGVIVGAGGERSFVADRAAADALAASDLRAGWFVGADALHLPGYSLLGETLGTAGRRAAELAHAAGAVVTVDLASSGPLLAAGRSAARRLIGSVAPDLIFATEGESAALLGGLPLERLLDLAPIAIVKRGARAASVLMRAAPRGGSANRFEVETKPIAAVDTTGAGDAFDAGFLASWLLSLPADRYRPEVLRRAVLAGHRSAARQLIRRPVELSFG